MAKNHTIKIGDVNVRIDDDSGYFCITDLASLRGRARDNIKNWMQNAQTINFFEAWEQIHVPANQTLNLDTFRLALSRDVAYSMSASRLIDAGCQGIFVQLGRYGGTYCHIDWATHFANWFDAFFYVRTLMAVRQLSDRVYGRDAARLRFSRDLASQSYGLITNAVDQSALPDPATKHVVRAKQEDSMVQRYLNQVSADIINLALWEMTALEWRTQFPPEKPRQNMRDFATAEELLVVNALQVLMHDLQQANTSPEEMLEHLSLRAQQLLAHYCATEEQQYILEKAREKRGW
jgi:hypothetical protein